MAHADDNEGIRVFAAVRPPEDVLHELGGLLDRGRREVPAARWVQSQQAHLTLAFWGSVPAPRADKLQRSLAEVAAERVPFELTLAGAAAVPDLRRARLAWIGATGGAIEYRRLASAVRIAARRAGVDSPRERLTAHLTLARLRRRGDAAAVLRVAESFEPRTWTVDSFELVESVLGRGGAAHSTVATFALGEPAA